MNLIIYRAKRFRFQVTLEEIIREPDKKIRFQAGTGWRFEWLYKEIPFSDDFEQVFDDKDFTVAELEFLMHAMNQTDTYWMDENFIRLRGKLQDKWRIKKRVEGWAND
jgi:hypothetical protein